MLFEDIITDNRSFETVDLMFGWGIKNVESCLFHFVYVIANNFLSNHSNDGRKTTIMAFYCSYMNLQLFLKNNQYIRRKTQNCEIHLFKKANPINTFCNSIPNENTRKTLSIEWRTTAYHQKLENNNSWFYMNFQNDPKIAGATTLTPSFSQLSSIPWSIVFIN